MSRVHTFRHRFKGGVTCEMTVDLDKLAARESDYVCCEYRRWMLSVWQHIANETGLKLMELLQVKEHLWEAAVFKPGLVGEIKEANSIV